VEIGPFDRLCGLRKFRACSAVHRAFDGFQAVDLTFSLTIAPGQVNGVADSVDASAQNTSKAGQGGEPGLNGIIRSILRVSSNLGYKIDRETAWQSCAKQQTLLIHA